MASPNSIVLCTFFTFWFWLIHFYAISSACQYMDNFFCFAFHFSLTRFSIATRIYCVNMFLFIMWKNMHSYKSYFISFTNNKRFHFIFLLSKKILEKKTQRKITRANVMRISTYGAEKVFRYIENPVNQNVLRKTKTSHCFLLQFRVHFEIV